MWTCASPTREDAKDVFGIAAENTDLNAGKVDQQGYISVARQLTERFGFKKVAITLRGSISASDNDWAGMLYQRQQGLLLSHLPRAHCGPLGATTASAAA